MTSAAHWERDDLWDRVQRALVDAGLDPERLDVDQLALTDQFHGGGRATTLLLAERAGVHVAAADGQQRVVLDVGGGLGGPARMLAARFGCRVTALDLTPSYVHVARLLTERVGLSEQVDHVVGDALDLPFDDASFDMVWTQNSGMNIADKRDLYAGFRRVLRTGGTLAFQEPMAGAESPLHYPVMWADDASSSFLLPPEEMRTLIVDAGFSERSWSVVEEATTVSSSAPAAHSVQRIVMGEAKLAAIAAVGRLNVAEQRVATIHGVFIAS